MHSDAGRHFLVTEMQRKVGDEPFRRLHITLRGIPGPGPERWIAAALALCAIGAGVFGTRGARSARAPRPNRRSRLRGAQARRCSSARASCAQLHEAGEIGPEYHTQQMTELETELAELLFEQEQHKQTGAPAHASAGLTG